MLKKVVTTILLFFTLLIIILAILLHFAFRPIKSSVTIELDKETSLYCEESLESDFHNATYYVDFTLKENDKSIYLGWGEFTSEDWPNQIVFRQIENWSILAVKDWGNLKILMVESSKAIRKDTLFMPNNLRYDDFWNADHKEIPIEYYGASRLDSVSKGNFFINYEYRVGNIEPFRFYSQRVEYSLNLEIGEFETKKVFDQVLK
ncbi:MAG: hypothetical protein AAF655_23285 [Bacteroidota bacterium]